MERTAGLAVFRLKLKLKQQASGFMVVACVITKLVLGRTLLAGSTARKRWYAPVMSSKRALTVVYIFFFSDRAQTVYCGSTLIETETPSFIARLARCWFCLSLTQVRILSWLTSKRQLLTARFQSK
jgi:hypothetical protein